LGLLTKSILDNPWRQDEDDLLIEKVQVLGQRLDIMHHFFISISKNGRLDI